MIPEIAETAAGLQLLFDCMLRDLAVRSIVLNVCPACSFWARLLLGRTVRDL